MNDTPQVTELRLVVTAPDYDQALHFYRDVLGLAERAAYASPGGRVTILEAGRATLELADPQHAAYIDQVEVGRRVAGHIRVAFQVGDAAAAAATGHGGYAVVALCGEPEPGEAGRRAVSTRSLQSPRLSKRASWPEPAVSPGQRARGRSCGVRLRGSSPWRWAVTDGPGSGGAAGEHVRRAADDIGG